MGKNGFGGKNLPDSLQKTGEDLDLLAKSTEEDFLSMGEVLQDFYVRAGEMSKTSASVARLMAGEELKAVTDGFRRVIKRIEALETDSRQSAAMLRRLLEVRSRLSTHLSGFQKTIRTLRVLCVSTRVESARLQEKDTGFGTLADEVGKLALEIEEKCSHLSVRSDSLRDLIAQALKKVSDLEAKQQAQAALIVRNTMAGLESLTERHELSAKCATDVSNRYEAVSRNIGEVVVSLQFHDITRQRIEHARDALLGVGRDGGASGKPEAVEEESDSSACRPGWRRRIRRLIPGVGGWRKGSGKNGERVQFCADICALQIAQLDSAKGMMVSAVENILDNLRKAADAVERAARETHMMAGAADETGRSFLAGVQAGFSSVVSAFSAYAETDRELSTAIASVGRTLGDMSTHTGAIEAIGEKIKLIALNAIVKASHIGDEGATLSVLAEAIRRLSAETRQQTETVTEALRSMTSESESLTSVVAADAGDWADEAMPIEKELTSLLSNLFDVEQNIVALLNRTNDEGAALSREILSALQRIDVHHRVDEAISGVVSDLREIVASSRALNPKDGQPEAAGYMQTLEASYTMREERDVHRSLIGEAAIPDDTGTEEPALAAVKDDAGSVIADGGMEGEPTEDLGDNVELF